MFDNLDVKKQYNPQFGNTVSGSFGMNAQPNNIIPAMQAQIDAASLNQAAADTYLGQRLTSFSDIDPLIQYGVTIPTWIAINQASELYLRACRGEYDKSIIHKFGSFGDKVSKFLFDNPVGNAINKAANNGKTFFKNKIYSNSALVRAFDLTPSTPELEMVRNQVGGIKSMLSHDGVSILDKFIEPIKDAKDFDSLGLPKSEIQRIQNIAAKAANDVDRAIILQSEEYKLLSGVTNPKDVQAFKNMTEAQRLAKLKELKIGALGFNGLSEFEMIKKAPEKYVDRLLEIFGNAQNKNRFARLSYSNKNFGTIVKGELVGRKVHFSELYNKIYAATGGNHKTALGRMLAKLSNNVMEGATSRIAGGKVAALMQAYFLAEAIIRANRQETGIDKARSFAERFAELIGFFVFIPPSLQFMHKVGGLQYSGMTPQQVERYREAVKEFNEHVMNCDWTKEIYKQKRKELRNLYRPHTKNPFVYLTRKAADVLTVGLEQIRPYTKHKVDKVDLNIMKILENPLQYLKNIPKRLKDMFRNPKYWAKQIAGYPMRFGIPMLVLIPFCNKILVKGVNAVVGKPKEGLLDESKYEEQQEQLRAAQAAASQQPVVSPAAAGVAAVQRIEQAAKPQVSQITYTGVPDHQPQETNEVITQKQPDIPENRYIPSTEPVKIKEKNNDDKELLAALKRAENAEKNAYNYLPK